MAPLLYYMKHCASIKSHQWIQTGVTVRKPSVQVKISDFLSRVTLKFDGRPWKTTGHLFYATSSCVHHFIAICEFKLELRSGNTQFYVKINDFLSCVTLKFDGWPWKIIGQLFYATSSSVHHFAAICEFKLELQSGKQLNWVLTSVTLTLDLWPWSLAWPSLLSMVMKGT